MRLLWEPAIYEHKAALIGRSPSEVARSADLLAQALLKEHEVYGADFLTVGIDVYNVEAEACGARLTPPAGNECPDIAAPLLDLAHLPGELDLPAIPKAGRFRVMLEAGCRARDALKGRAAVRVAASGPMAIAAKLAGAENLILSLALRDSVAETLLSFATALSEAWLDAIAAAGLDAIIFDSPAAPPILSPRMYEEAILPLHQRLMARLAAARQENRPLIIGGDTTPIAALLARTGANHLICDFTADAAAFSRAISGGGAISVRRNVRPAELALQYAAAGGITAGLAAESAANRALVRRYCADLRHFRRPVAGTGILPFDFVPSHFLQFRQAVDAAFHGLLT